MRPFWRQKRGILLLVVGLLAMTGPAQAAEYPDGHLFERFNVALEASVMSLTTGIRLDGPMGNGVTFTFEDEGDLDKSAIVPSLSLEWRMGRRHLLRAWFMTVDRDASTQLLEEIEFDGMTFPVDEVVTFGFDQSELGIGYDYFFVVKPRIAWGLGGGLRTLKIRASLASEGNIVTGEGEGSVTGPLPFIDTQLRWGFGKRWRLVGDIGIFYVEIEEISGGQMIIDTSVEHLTWKNVGFGAGVRGGFVEVDVEGSEFGGAIRLAVGSVRAFVRIRFGRTKS